MPLSFGPNAFSDAANASAKETGKVINPALAAIFFKTERLSIRFICMQKIVELDKKVVVQGIPCTTILSLIKHNLLKKSMIYFPPFGAEASV